MNEKGQEFEGFRMIIAVIIAAVVLTFIVATIAYFDELKFQISQDRLKKGLISAAQSPNSPDSTEPHTITVDNLTFKNGTGFTAESFAEKINEDAECVNFCSNNKAIKIQEGLKRVMFEATIVSDVFIYCVIPQSKPECSVVCGVGFGVNPKDKPTCLP